MSFDSFSSLNGREMISYIANTLIFILRSGCVHALGNSMLVGELGLDF